MLHMRNYVSGQCLNQEYFGAFGGKHRRNLFTARETRNLAHYFQIGMVLEEFLLNLDISRKSIKSFATLFWVTFIGLYLPLKYLFKCETELPSLFLKPKVQASLSTFYKIPTSYIARSPTIEWSPEIDRRKNEPEYFSVQVEPEECSVVRPKSSIIYVKPYLVID